MAQQMNLKEKLEELLKAFTEKPNLCLGSNFWDDYANEDDDVLDFLTEKFCDIDMMWHDDMDIGKAILYTLRAGIKMIKNKEKGVQFVSVKMHKDDYNKVETLLPDICPDVACFVKEADHTLVDMGLCKSAPCVITFGVGTEEFYEMLDMLNDVEIDAFNTQGTSHDESSQAYQKYLKYGCLYDILSNAEMVYSPIGKVRYVGKSFGVVSLTDGKEYDVIGIEHPFIRVVDDSNEDYLYSISKPGSMEDPDLCGEWVIVKDEKGILKNAFE